MPSSASVHIDTALSNVSVMYNNEAFIASRILPIVVVNKRSDKYFVYGKAPGFTRINPLTGPKSAVTEVDYTISTSNYSVLDYAFKGFVSYSDAANADAPLDLFVDETEHVTKLLLHHLEKQVATVYFDSATYATANKATPATKWGNASSTPVAQIITGINAIVGVPGPFCAAMGNKAWELLRQHPDILSAIQPTSSAVAASIEAVRGFFGFEELLVGDAWENTALPGATEAYGRIWGDAVLIFKRNTSLRTKEVSLGYIFQVGQRETQRWEDLSLGPTGGEWVKVGWSYDVKTVAADAAYLLYDVEA